MVPRMPILEHQFQAQQRSWRLLTQLRAREPDLSVLARLPDTIDFADHAALESLLIDLGLNDEGSDEFPASLQPALGRGLLVWQYPNQFAPYLSALAELGVHSYLELGVRHGGSFIATVEILRRAAPIARAIAVDVLPCPALDRYTPEGVAFWQVSTLTPRFHEQLHALGAIDLAMIDTHHEAEQCWAEFQRVAPIARMVALHDIANIGCPGVGEVWRRIRQLPGYRCLEFTAQYDRGPFMGIGLAIRSGA